MMGKEQQSRIGRREGGVMMRGRRTREEDHDGEMKIVFEGVNGFFLFLFIVVVADQFSPSQKEFRAEKGKSIIR